MQNVQARGTVELANNKSTLCAQKRVIQTIAGKAPTADLEDDTLPEHMARNLTTRAMATNIVKQNLGA